jgi:hypothetical protein
MYISCKVRFLVDHEQVALCNPVAAGILKISKLSVRKAFYVKNASKKKFDNTPRVEEFKFDLAHLANIVDMSVLRVDKELQEMKVFKNFLFFLIFNF